MSGPKIESLWAPGSLFPIVDGLHKARTCYFSPSKQIIYPPPSGEPIPIGLQHKTASLTLKFNSGNLPKGSYRWALLGEREITHPFDFQVDTDKPQGFSTAKLLTIPIISGHTKSLPWSITGKLNAMLKRIEGDNEFEVMTVKLPDIEIYVLFDELPDYFAIRGIPRALLQFDTLIPKWMQDTTENSWVKFVIKAVFGDSRLTYEPNGDGFGGWYTRSHGSQVHLDLWLSDLMGLTERGDTTSKYEMTCRDCAGICSVIISLGADFRSVKRVICWPFGYIYPTRLIGNGPLCNNPFYRTNKTYFNKPIYTYPSPKPRSKFKDHVFLVHVLGTDQGERILDACCGPQLGDLNITDYLMSAIDRTEGLYLGSDPNRPAVEADVISLGPTSSLISSGSLLNYDPNKEKMLQGVLSAVYSAFKDWGQLAKPYIATADPAVTPGFAERPVTVTWTFKPKQQMFLPKKDDSPENGPPTVVMALYQFSHNSPCEYFFSDLVAGLENVTRAQINHDVIVRSNHDIIAGAFVILHMASSFRVVILRISKGPQTDLDPWRERIYNALKGVTVQKLSAGTKGNRLEFKIREGPSPRVGEKFDVTIVPREIDSKRIWMSYFFKDDPEEVGPNTRTISNMKSSVLLEAKDTHKSNQAVTFTFLARRPGLDSYCVELVDNNLKIYSITVNVNIDAASGPGP
ncbi:hypothetical protein K432DRAFT_151644 [Lepidopterella palustris CBS 459.81]|uniref:Uncharacterized protein n=1 Tax=Lepidopterella palustris CBS 459.81 TaxID=1314670 RepID=A0A8E2E2M6_9PEZI|nr:hypothetical protein K432DRAFT_151644 [Lepidopterella palustris CBS 459.81]